MIDGCLMIADLVVKRAEREINQRRRALHRLQNILAAFDDLMHFETEPATFVIA